MLVFFFYCWFDHNETASCTPVSHSCHWLTRNTGWWKNASNNYSEGRSKKTFQFSRSMFRDILNRIGPFLARGNYDRGSNFPITGASALVISIRIFIYDCRDSRVRSIYSLFALFHNFSKTGLTICYRTACFPAPLQFHFSWRQNRVCRSVPGTSNKYIFVFLRQEENDCSSFSAIFVM